jgi:hypothetical protein
MYIMCTYVLPAPEDACCLTSQTSTPSFAPAAQLDDWMEAHEQQEEARRKAREAAMSEDGWTMVVRGKVRLPGWSCRRQMGGPVGHCAPGAGSIAGWQVIALVVVARRSEKHAGLI